MSPLPDPNRTLQSREPVRFLVFAASLRMASLNARLHGGTVDEAAMADCDVPTDQEDDQAKADRRSETRSVLSHENPPSASGARPKWP